MSGASEKDAAMVRILQWRGAMAEWRYRAIAFFRILKNYNAARARGFVSYPPMEQQMFQSDRARGQKVSARLKAEAAVRVLGGEMPKK